MENPSKYTRSMDKPSRVLFGVDWDEKTINLLNAVLMDIIAYKRVVGNNGVLTVVCKDPAFLRRACNAMQVDCVELKGFGKDCVVWKLYYEKTCPEIPVSEGSVYVKKVSAPDPKVLVMEQGRPRYPSLYNYRDNVALPPGRNPNINRIPPRMHNGLPNVIAPWY